MKRQLSKFTGAGYSKGKSKTTQAIWFAVQNLIFIKWWLPKSLRPVLLRMFGAKIGSNAFIRHKVRILWPWKLEIGNDCWLGEDLWILNLEDIKIGDDVCLSQGVMLCSGGHDYNSESFEYRNSPITIGDGVWLAVQTLILPGVKIGNGATILARCTVSQNVAENKVIKSTRH